MQLIPIKDLVEQNGVDNVRVVTKMRAVTFVIGGIGVVSSDTPEQSVMCRIDETRYPVKDGYKITLRPMTPGYGFSHLYQEDFDALAREGRIRVFVETIDGLLEFQDIR